MKIKYCAAIFLFYISCLFQKKTSRTSYFKLINTGQDATIWISLNLTIGFNSGFSLIFIDILNQMAKNKKGLNCMKLSLNCAKLIEITRLSSSQQNPLELKTIVKILIIQLFSKLRTNKIYFCCLSKKRLNLHMIKAYQIVGILLRDESFSSCFPMQN